MASGYCIGQCNLRRWEIPALKEGEDDLEPYQHGNGKMHHDMYHNSLQRVLKVLKWMNILLLYLKFLKNQTNTGSQF